VKRDFQNTGVTGSRGNIGIILLLIRHSKYSAMLSKIHTVFFGNFAHWILSQTDLPLVICSYL